MEPLTELSTGAVGAAGAYHRAKGQPVSDGPWGTHVATADHEAVPQVTFTDPEVALRPRMVMGTFASAWEPSARPEQRHPPQAQPHHARKAEALAEQSAGCGERLVVAAPRPTHGLLDW